MATQFTITPIPAGVISAHRPTLSARIKALFSSPIAINTDRATDTITVDGQGHDFTAQEEADLRAVFAGHLVASMGSDKPSITADDSDTATITMSHASIQNGETIEYSVYLNGSLEIAGTETASVGACQYAFTTGVAGTYQIVMRRQNENESGIIEVEATNA